MRGSLTLAASALLGLSGSAWAAFAEELSSFVVARERLTFTDGGTLILSGVTTDYGGLVIFHDVRVILISHSYPQQVRAQCDAEALLGERSASLLEQIADEAETLSLFTAGNLARDGSLMAYLRADGRDVGERLISAGLARPRSDGEPLSWCGTP